MKSKCRVCKSKDTSSCSRIVRAALVVASVIVRSQEIRRSRRRSNSKKTARADRRWRKGNGKERGQEGSLREWRMGEWKLLRTLQHVAATTAAATTTSSSWLVWHSPVAPRLMGMQRTNYTQITKGGEESVQRFLCIFQFGHPSTLHSPQTISNGMFHFYLRSTAKRYFSTRDAKYLFQLKVMCVKIFKHYVGITTKV